MLLGAEYNKFWDMYVRRDDYNSENETWIIAETGEVLTQEHEKHDYLTLRMTPPAHS